MSVDECRSALCIQLFKLVWRSMCGCSHHGGALMCRVGHERHERWDDVLKISYIANFIFVSSRHQNIVLSEDNHLGNHPYPSVLGNDACHTHQFRWHPRFFLFCTIARFLFCTIAFRRVTVRRGSGRRGRTGRLSNVCCPSSNFTPRAMPPP